MSGGPLVGRVALVTGSSRGVGRAIAVRLAADGASVAVNYRQGADAAAAAVAEIRAHGGTAEAYAASIDDDAAVDAMLEGIRRDLGPIDILVSNAGRASSGRSVQETPDREYRSLIEVHALAPVRLIAKALPGMRDAARSDIVVISSVLTETAPAGTAPYGMAKAAMEFAARSLAKEERRHGVRVNIVAPGLVATDMGSKLVMAEAAGEISDLDASSPFGRVCRPEDVAVVVAAIVAPELSYVSGQRIVVDGGGPDVSASGL